MDPQSTAALTQMGLGYHPMAPGLNHGRRMPTDGLPFMQGQFGQLAGMAMIPHMQQAFGQVGMTPMGLGHDQNVYDRMMNQRFTQMQMQAMQAAAESDRSSYMRTFRGLSAMTGTPFGADQRRAAQSLASSAVMFAPAFAEMAPDFMDQMGGSRGSATVMARRMIDAGRYRMDPVTGRMGMSAESVGAISNRLYGHLYSEDNLPRMRGVTAGQVGSMVQELQSRGMIGTAAAQDRNFDPRANVAREIGSMAFSQPSALMQAAKNTGVDLSKKLTASDIDKLNLDPAVADKMRSLDADRIKRAVQSYVGVTSAIKEIFGDNGKPNAPMAELMRALETMTSGSMAQINPGRLTSMVRQTANLAKQTGMTLDGAMAIQGHASNRAMGMGIESVFGVQAAQGAMGFGGAYRAQGHGMYTAWGAMNSDQVTQLDANLRVQAASSNMANRMAVAARMAESAGGFNPDSAAGRYAAAARTEANQFRDESGNIRSLNMSDRDFTQLMMGATGMNGKKINITEGDVQGMLAQRDTNREYVEKYGMMNAVRRAQGRDEIQPFIGNKINETLFARLRNRGMSPERAREVASQVSGGVAQEAHLMSTEEFSDTESRNRGLGRAIERGMKAAGAGDFFAGMDDEQKKQFLEGTADLAHGNVNHGIRGGQFRAFGNWGNVHRLTNETTLNESDRQQMQAQFTGQMQDALSPLGKGSLLSRAVDAIQNRRDGDKTPDAVVVASALGGVKTSDINKALLPELVKLNAIKAKFAASQAAVLNEKDPVKREALQRQLNVYQRQTMGQASIVAKAGESIGIFTTDTLNAEDTTRAMSSLYDLETAQRDLIGLSGNFGNEVTDDQLSGLNINTQNDTERYAILSARQQRDVETVREHLNDPSKKLTDDLAKDFAGYVAQSKERGAGRTLTDRQINNGALALMQADVGSYTADQLSKITTANSVEDKRVLLRTRRRLLPMRPNKASVDAVKSKYPGASDKDAYELATTRLRAERLGINAMTGGTLEEELAGYNNAFTKKASGAYDISPEEKAAFGFKPPTAEAISSFREKYGIEGDDNAVVDAMKTATILKHKQAANKAQFADFWSKGEGEAYRMSVRNAGLDVEDAALKLIEGPNMTQRLGMQAVELSDELRGGQQRLRELANFHAGGDTAKLLAGDYSIDMAKKGAVDTVINVRAEVNKIQAREREILGRLNESMGKTGRQFRLGDKDIATQKAKADLAAGLIKPEEMDTRIQHHREKSGNAAEARALLGFGTGPLDSVSQGMLDSVSSGVATARLLTPEQDRIAMKGNKEEIEALAKQLNVTPADLAGAAGVSKMLAGRQTSAAGRWNANMTDVTRDILKSYGFSAGDTATPFHQSIGQMLQGTKGREFAHAILSTNSVLTRTAGGTAAQVDAMSDAYRKASESKEKAAEMRKFRETYGLGDEAQFSTFEKAMQFQDQTGFLKFGKGRKLHDESDLQKLATEYLNGGKQAASNTDGKGGNAGPTKIEMSGKVKISWDEMDMGGSAGRNHHNT